MMGKRSIDRARATGTYLVKVQSQEAKLWKRGREGVLVRAKTKRLRIQVDMRQRSVEGTSTVKCVKKCLVAVRLPVFSCLKPSITFSRRLG